MNNIIIFDLDGVITSERAYWDTAGLVLHELLYSPQYWNVNAVSGAYQPPQTAEESRRVSRATFPEPVIVGLKARSVNSNWDTCYAGFCFALIDLLAKLPDCSSLLPLQPAEQPWIVQFREQLARAHIGSAANTDMFQRLNSPLLQGYTGLDLINRFDAYASSVLGCAIESVFARYGPSWRFCSNLFQEWYLGEELYTQTYGHAPKQPGKPGCIHFEQPLLPVEQMRPTLETLRERGYTLGIATGRPRKEGLAPLKNYGLLHYFDEQHITTHAEVARAEAELRARGDMTPLVKPHPYQFLLAADPAYTLDQPLPPRGSFVVVGDTPSDVRGAQAAGALIIAVLTGALTAEARTMLEQSQPDFIIEDMTKVPALLEYIDSLATIQQLQFTDRAKAELLLQRWFALHMGLRTESVTLTPKAVSLNSFNGIYRSDNEEYFFKTHIEEQGILEEYYHAELLSNAGYNIVRPLRTVHEKDQQMVIYPVIHQPVMFDLIRAVETGVAENVTVSTLIAAEKRECERLLAIYQATFASSTAEEHAQAPIHQLFWHRLTGGRLKAFYEEKLVPFPAAQPDRNANTGISFNELLRYRWSINGVALQGDCSTLGHLIERAKVVLQPQRAGVTVIGHGDAHFGNVFLEDQQQYLYFDPAFAGRHSPLLDIVKPFFHNVFATWMYFAQQVAQELQLSVALRGDTIYIEHNYTLTPTRQALWETKIEHLLRPLLAMLRSEAALPVDWEEIVTLALMCCPLLTVNLLDQARIPVVVSWLGLTQAMQIGSDRSMIGR
ncbi:MAG TPA: HAD family hydrolase [Ktedonosporobacter sp.]|nr:HAD family hydrolase [Ktedonosporobacter sp.]